MIETLMSRFLGSPISFVHEFHRPPYGGGNQFLLALMDAFNRLGHPSAPMRIGKRTHAVLFNSFNFDMERLRRVLRDRQTRQIRTLHRVDGPIAAYRGSGIEIDQSILAVSQDLADVSVFQSSYSLEKHLELGLEFENAHVISNAVNPAIFHDKSRLGFPTEASRRIRIVATSWSPNPRKGQHVYEWLDENLDFERFEMKFIGNTKAVFHNIEHLQPKPSAVLAQLLRASDIYITASENDPCSNALIEALSCGLPAIFRKSGGHPEIVGNAGLGFDHHEEIPALLDTLASNHSHFQSRISVSHIDDIAHAYLKLLLN